MTRLPGLKFIGKIGAFVYYYRHGYAVVRPYYKPVQPGTGAQAQWWAKFRAGVSAWQALTPVEKKAWQKIADDFAYEGFNRWMSKFMKK